MNERTTATTTTTTQAPYRKRTGGKPKYVPKRKVCPFCSDKTETIDYKDPMKLRRFISERAKIEPRRRTGVCARHQRVLASAIKRARQLALLPYVPSHMRPIGGTAAQTQ